MAVRIVGYDELHRALVEITQNIGNKSLISSRLHSQMRIYAHVDTGYMRSTIYHTNMDAGADAYYAGFEADRGGDHDFAQLAIDNFPIEEYLDELVAPF